MRAVRLQLRVARGEEVSDYRDALSGVMDVKLTADQWEKLIDEVMATVKKVVVDFNCKKCGQAQRHPVEIPDAVNVAKGLSILGTDAKGKPAQTVRHDVNVSVGFKLPSEMTLAEINEEVARARAARKALGA